jgi:thymidylate synthase
MKQYLDLLTHVQANGRIKKNRTGVDTIGVFGAQARFPLYPTFPLLTTKKVHFKAIVHELLWFIRGDTNITYLVRNDVKIWNEWAYERFKVYCTRINLEPIDMEEFIEQIRTDDAFASHHGELGMGTYGGMWREFPFNYDTRAIPSIEDEEEHQCVGRVDQLAKIDEKLRSNPDDRRMIVSAWHPYWVDRCALPPCHVLFHFNTEVLTLEERNSIVFDDPYDKYNTQFVGFQHPLDEETLDRMKVPKRRLNCLLYQRSADLPIGVPFNIASYALLTCMLAASHNMHPGEFVHTYGDLHIYVNQLDGVKEQLSREPKELPRLKLNAFRDGLHLVRKSIFDYTYEDIQLIGYDPHPAIKMPVAV